MPRADVDAMKSVADAAPLFLDAGVLRRTQAVGGFASDGGALPETGGASDVFLVRFPIHPDAELACVAKAYAVSIPPEWQDKPVSEVLAIGAGGEPGVGDQFAFGHLRLVVTGTGEGKVTAVAIEIGHKASCLQG